MGLCLPASHAGTVQMPGYAMSPLNTLWKPCMPFAQGSSPLLSSYQVAIVMPSILSSILSTFFSPNQGLWGFSGDPPVPHPISNISSNSKERRGFYSRQSNCCPHALNLYALSLWQICSLGGMVASRKESLPNQWSLEAAGRRCCGRDDVLRFIEGATWYGS